MLGLGASLLLRGVLVHWHVFQTSSQFALFYAGTALVGGCLALYHEKPIIIAVTSLSGAFVVTFGMVVCILVSFGCIIALLLTYDQGIGYFVSCNFITLVTHVEDAMRTHPPQIAPLPQCGPLLSVVGSFCC